MVTVYCVRPDDFYLFAGRRLLGAFFAATVFEQHAAPALRFGTVFLHVPYLVARDGAVAGRRFGALGAVTAFRFFLPPCEAELVDRVLVLE